MNYTISYESDIKIKLDKNGKILQKKLEELSDLQYEIELIKKNSLGTVKGIHDSIQSVDLPQIWRDFDHEKHKFNPDGSKSKNQLKYIEMAYLFKSGRPKDVKLKDIVLYGFNFETWLVYMKGNKEFVITLPIFRNAEENNYADLGYKIFAVDGCCYELEFKTLFLSEVMDGVSKFLDKLDETLDK